jgi:protein-disulfide isomerase
VLLLLIAGTGGWLAARAFSDPAAGLSNKDRQAIETVVRDYILEHPEILPQAMENLQHKSSAKALAAVDDEVKTPYPGAILGNPKGTVTLVEFSDFACGYCRHSVADIEALVKANPDLRIVVRELPILSEESAAAARMALAAAEQGKYPAFYHAMFALGRPGTQAIEAAARQAGMDLEKAKAAIASPRVEKEIARNLELARHLGFGGTPSWIAGDKLISGAVGVEELAKVLKEVRS